tara:strand:- start:33 stop:1070 length:1038 start_codon:yes stop_codon:yes gene_type:complete
MAYATISKPELYFNTKLYTGTGSSNAITGVGFQPDFTWIKDRDATNNHSLYDAVRGVTKVILSNSSNAETTYAQGLTAFGTDGFTVGTDSQNNTNGNNLVSWNWKAGTGQGSSNSDGTINTTYTSVNTTAGFSVSSYTGNGTNGATIGHGLGAVPRMVWIKRLSNSDGMIMYHHKLGNAASMKFDRTDGVNTGNFWNSTTPTSSVVTVTNSTECNVNGQTYVMYSWAEKKGFSKFGQYTGNNSSDGMFVFTGFKPALVIVKRSDGSNDWCMYDNKRDVDNPVEDKLQANSTAAESNDLSMDFVANGFKFRQNGGNFNGSYAYIYMAWAESPLVINQGESFPVTAR